MNSFRYQAWHFCRMLKAHTDKNEAWAVYGRAYSEVFDKEEILRKTISEVKGGTKTSKLNHDHVTLRHKLCLLKTFSSGIGVEDARKFYHYLQTKGLIEVDAKVGDAIEVTEPTDYDDGFFEIGTLIPDKLETSVTIRLTNDGIDLGEKSLVRLYSDEWALALSALALIVSIFALGNS